MATDSEVVGGPQAISIWDLPIGELATAMTPASVRGHAMLQTAYGPVDTDDWNATFVQPFAMQVLPWGVGDKLVLTKTS